MASKDQAIGTLIFLVCAILAIGYIVALFLPDTFLAIIQLDRVFPWMDAFHLQLWATAIVVFIAFMAIMFIGAWIGWTMATTPPPKPIEELELEEEIEEAPEPEQTSEEKPKRKRARKTK
jgi:hypothetical protein